MTILSTQFPIRLLQITDTHLYAAPAGTLLKMNTQTSLEHVISVVKSRADAIDLILATGDIAQDGSHQAYESFITSVESLQSPVRWIPGNHDNPQAMREVAEGRDLDQRSLQINNWLLLFLDTTAEGEVSGQLRDEELEFLNASLTAAESDPSIEHCMVCLHHNPLRTSCEWMDDIGLQNATEFFAVIKPYSKMNSVVYGHIHQEVDTIHEGVRYLCAPSTCIQFKPDACEFELDDLNPGYRVFDLFADGSMETAVRRVTDRNYTVDHGSPGY